MRIVEITTEPIDLDPIVRSMTTPECGAVLTFLGVVRNHAGDRAVERIDYTSYEGMAESELRKVVDAACDRHGVSHCAVVHRLGTLAVGDASLGVVVASPHRAEAFACGLEIIDEMKKTVPIWKREIGPDGQHWVNA